jgi:hypothetical protein
MEVEWGETEQEVKLETLRYGDPFLDGFGILTVKTDTRADAGRWYCLHIRDGRLVRMATNLMVRPIGAKVVVTRREES